MRALLCAVISLASAVAARAEDRYVFKDSGTFGITGRFIEFADRYAWQSYQASFDFGYSSTTERIALKSTLDVVIFKKNGKKWKYRCRNANNEMTPSVNFIYGKGARIQVECPVQPKKFAQAVGLDVDMVGEPYLVFQVYVKDGQVISGVRKGFYILTEGQVPGSEMAQYSVAAPDPTDLSVVFASQPSPGQPPP